MTASKVICILIILVIVLTSCSTSKSVSVAVPEPAYWPTDEWQSSTPEAQGMDSVLLAQMLEEISSHQTRIHSILIVRNGYLVTEAYFHPYTRDTKVQVQSITKSVIGALVGIAIRDGSIKSVNEKLLDFFPKRSIANPGPDKSAIRLKHLLSMSSGFPCQEFSSSGQSMEQSSGWVQYMLDLPVDTAPGKTFGYCDGNPHLLSAILGIRTGMDAREYANRELFQPLGIPPAEKSDWITVRRASQMAAMACYYDLLTWRNLASSTSTTGNGTTGSSCLKPGPPIQRPSMFRNRKVRATVISGRCIPNNVATRRWAWAGSRSMFIHPKT